MINIKSFQFALEVQGHYIGYVYSLQGNIQLSIKMKEILVMALIIIIEDEIKRLKKEMIAHINSEIDGCKN